ncbi:transposase [Candidatus Thiodiazotropha sp. LNASS1]|uniref:transposase n=1 Tax=Candidatus Thiodiazotropha sp. LNASS1 TaxID=3096260 RepID=UPI0034DE8B68
MSRSRFSEEKILAVLKEAEESDEKITEICSKHGISDATFYKWRSKYGDQSVNDSRRLKQLEDENKRLRALVADLALRNQALKRVVSKKW